MKTIDGHVGGSKNNCPRCSDPVKAQKCAFYNADGSLTRYAFACGYLEERMRINLSKEHNTYHVKGFTCESMRVGERVYATGERVLESFDDLTSARKFLHKFPKHLK